jgi:tetratricopeptide (TPR) repeat protein
MLFLESFKRVAAPGDMPYPRAEAIDRTLALLSLQTYPREQPGTEADASRLVSEARSLAAQGLTEQALLLLDRAIELAPTSFEAWEERGGKSWDTGHIQDALINFECAVILAPSNAGGWGNYGLPLAALGRYEEALRAYDRAITLGASTWSWTRRGEALNALGRYDEALEAFEEALSPPMLALLLGTEHNWIRANAWTGKAVALRALGREAEAQAADRHVKELGG